VSYISSESFILNYPTKLSKESKRFSCYTEKGSNQSQQEKNIPKNNQSSLKITQDTEFACRRSLEVNIIYFYVSIVGFTNNVTS